MTIILPGFDQYLTSMCLGSGSGSDLLGGRDHFDQYLTSFYPNFNHYLTIIWAAGPDPTCSAGGGRCGGRCWRCGPGCTPRSRARWSNAHPGHGQMHTRVTVKYTTGSRSNAHPGHGQTLIDTGQTMVKHAGAAGPAAHPGHVHAGQMHTQVTVKCTPGSR